jgi:hypothetical protein
MRGNERLRVRHRERLDPGLGAGFDRVREILCAARASRRCAPTTSNAKCSMSCASKIPSSAVVPAIV